MIYFQHFARKNPAQLTLRISRPWCISSGIGGFQPPDRKGRTRTQKHSHSVPESVLIESRHTLSGETNRRQTLEHSLLREASRQRRNGQRRIVISIPHEQKFAAPSTFYFAFVASSPTSIALKNLGGDQSDKVQSAIKPFPPNKRRSIAADHKKILISYRIGWSYGPPPANTNAFSRTNIRRGATHV